MKGANKFPEQQNFPHKTQETPTFQEIALFETSIAPKWLPIIMIGILDIHPGKLTAGT